MIDYCLTLSEQYFSYNHEQVQHIYKNYIEMTDGKPCERLLTYEQFGLERKQSVFGRAYNVPTLFQNLQKSFFLPSLKTWSTIILSVL